MALDEVAELMNVGEGSSLYSLVPLPLSVFDDESATRSPPVAAAAAVSCIR